MKCVALLFLQSVNLRGPLALQLEEGWDACICTNTWHPLENSPCSLSCARLTARWKVRTDFSPGFYHWLGETFSAESSKNGNNGLVFVTQWVKSTPPTLAISYWCWFVSWLPHFWTCSLMLLEKQEKMAQVPWPVPIPWETRSSWLWPNSVPAFGAWTTSWN